MIENLQNILGHLGNQFEKAQPVLFTGAGFSMGAKNVLGESVPGANGLREQLWQLCFGDAPFEATSSLQDLYQTALNRHSGKLSELLVATFSVDPETLPGWYSTVFNFPWYRCYTLNIDNLDSAVQHKFELARALGPISATAARRMGASPQKQVGLEVVHLNGTLQDAPYNVTFSLAQYGARLNEEDRWLSQVAADLLTRPIVFIGAQLDEPPLWQHVELGRSRKGKSERELRPKSYLVTPSLSRARQACLMDYNIVWLPLTGEEFCNQILVPLKERAVAGLQLIAELQKEGSAPAARLSEVSEIATNPSEKTLFLLGAEPAWSDLQSGRAIEREVDSRIWSEVEPLVKSSSLKGIVLISGTAGAGKSTSLKRVALRLTSAGHRVAWFDSSTRVAPHEIKRFMMMNNHPNVLAMDDADLFGGELTSLIAEICLDMSYPLVICAIRSGKVDRIINPIQLRNVPKSEIFIPNLTDGDIDGLLQVLEREHNLGVLAEKSSVEERRQVFREKCGRQLIVAMMEATSGKPFEQKIVSELHQADPQAEVAYGLIAIATAWRMHLTKSELLLAIGDADNEVLNALGRLVQTHVITLTDSGHYLARHKVIAEVVMKELTESGTLPELMYGLAFAASTQIDRSTDPRGRPYMLLQRIENHDFLIKAIGVEEARHLYGRLENLVYNNFNFWLQRGSLEVTSGNLALAESYLNNAHGLNAIDQNTQTEYAYLLFRKAIAYPSADGAEEMVAEANRLLLANIASRGYKDAHSYHVLGLNSLQWVAKGITDWDAKRTELERVIEIVKKGRELHPHNEALKQVLSNLQDEYLGLTLAR